MLTIKTHQGKEIEILLQTELDDPIDTGEHVRAYCHLHGSDHFPSTKPAAGDTASMLRVMPPCW